eukprot:GHVH01017433.1.p2 GENE.GHVH01017433.1~~GHVH01017433.1.p2  ORF type:complete len:127 (+),score=19.83 GHVH01017433.1:688-1068(+)
MTDESAGKRHQKLLDIELLHVSSIPAFLKKDVNRNLYHSIDQLFNPSRFSTNQALIPLYVQESDQVICTFEAFSEVVKARMKKKCGSHRIYLFWKKNCKKNFFNSFMPPLLRDLKSIFRVMNGEIG